MSEDQTGFFLAGLVVGLIFGPPLYILACIWDETVKARRKLEDEMRLKAKEREELISAHWERRNGRSIDEFVGGLVGWRSASAKEPVKVPKSILVYKFPKRVYWVETSLGKSIVSLNRIKPGFYSVDRLVRWIEKHVAEQLGEGRNGLYITIYSHLMESETYPNLLGCYWIETQTVEGFVAEGAPREWAEEYVANRKNLDGWYLGDPASPKHRRTTDPQDWIRWVEEQEASI